MKLPNLAIALSFFAATAGMAQGPLNDRIIVKMPYAMNVNGTLLQPGDYEIKQHDSTGGGSRVLFFYSDKGMKFETTAMAIPALENKTPEKTELMLNQYGNDYYLNKIWVQGKNYGYEFPIPDSVKSREKEMKASTISARYDLSAENASVTKTETTETAEVTAPAPARVDAAPAPVSEPVAQSAPVEIAQSAPAPVEIAQNTPPSPPVMTPSASQTLPERESPPMPSTASNWLDFVLAGTAFVGLGLMLRRSVTA